MELREQLEYPAPVINRSTNKIDIETAVSCEGSLTIKNDGGGDIKGRIMSNSRVLSFEPEYFSGNDSKIIYTVNLDILKPGDTFQTEAFVISNGGEFAIEFNISVIPYAIETEQGKAISSMEDFYQYAMAYPIHARQLFVGSEFMLWLESIGYAYMDMYELFIRDANKERAVDNFLILNGFKERADFQISEQEVCIKFRPSDHDPYRGFVNIDLVGWGYLEEKIQVKNNSSWLRIDKEKLLSADFAPKDSFNLFYSINPRAVTSRLARDTVLIGDQKINFTVIKKNFLEIQLERDFLDFEDQSNLIVHNYTGTKLSIDIIPGDTFIKFEGYHYKVGDFAKIPFQVKMTALQKAQMALKKQSVMDSLVSVSSEFNGLAYNNDFVITIGNFL